MPYYTTIWFSVNIILCLLFWILALQNKNQKNISLIALTETGLLLSIYCKVYSDPDSSIIVYRIATIVFPIVRTTTMILFILLMLRIFKRNITALLRIALSALFLGGIIQLFVSESVIAIIISFQNVTLLLIVTSNIILSWKKLKGAQWAVLAGMLLSIFFGVLLATSRVWNPGLNPSFISFYFSGIFLSYPLSLLVYITMRFNEIIHEVRENASQVVRLSEEKKVQALNQQKLLQEEVNRQTRELRNTLNFLKETQSQLIQSEKMASLGELTAGIAHEIQNPLNFVNNFSEINKELVDEIRAEIQKGNLTNAMENLGDLDQNLQKITTHGKRADAIVKSMLQHTRTSAGKKEPTDINNLCDEYLRLAFHGMRARNKSFISELKTDFDPSIGKINIIPQDIGRVLLNLYNNAFQAVNDKVKENGSDYNPMVSVRTKKKEGKLEISVKDNGIGIPESIKEKIFQPFFTTKPTGQGTGLGLSLSYDIVKAHGGEIRVETEEGESTTFLVSLPT